jgi:large subunit ribosomal protein L19
MYDILSESNFGRSAARLCKNAYVSKEEVTMDLMTAFTNEQLKENAPVINIGDTVVVHCRIKDGNNERIQLFEGTVIAKKGGGISETFTVRKISYGVGVEKIFPVHSPNVAKVDVVRKGKVRRAKLYYLRDRVGKSSKVKERI